MSPLEKARKIWDDLDTYGKSQLLIWGTSFTTYEDEGPEVCGYLGEIVTDMRAQVKAHGNVVCGNLLCEVCGEATNR